MDAPDFLSISDVLEMHAELIEQYGGSHGVRDMGLLQSALAVPQAGVGDAYFHADVFEMASAYLFHLVKNHPFVDGNKRIGVTVAMQFLFLNQVEVTATERALGDVVLAVVEGRLEKHDVATFLRAHAI